MCPAPGKSSLAIDTLYAEGQRRFVESFSPYARQFLERLERPPMTRLEPVPAGIAVDRRAPVKSSRSTVATMADIQPYLAALFLREARPVCPDHGVEGTWLDTQSAAERIAAVLGNRQAIMTYSVPRRRTPSDYLEVRDGLVRDGFRRAYQGGKVVDLDALAPSRALAGGGLEVVVDRLVPARDPGRLAQGIEAGWQRSSGLVSAHAESESVSVRQGFGCPSCAKPLEAPRAGPVLVRVAHRCLRRMPRLRSHARHRRRARSFKTRRARSRRARCVPGAENPRPGSAASSRSSASATAFRWTCPGRS